MNSLGDAVLRPVAPGDVGGGERRAHRQVLGGDEHLLGVRIDLLGRLGRRLGRRRSQVEREHHGDQASGGSNTQNSNTGELHVTQPSEGRSRPTAAVSRSNRVLMVNQGCGFLINESFRDQRSIGIALGFEYGRRFRAPVGRARRRRRNPLADRHVHPDRVRIRGEPGGGQRDPIWHARPVIVQPLDPGLTDDEGGQDRPPESKQKQSQRTAEDRGDGDEFDGAVPAQPQRRDRSELGVAAADPPEGEAEEGDRQHRCRRPPSAARRC